MTGLGALVVSLINTICVMIVVAYMLNRTEVYSKLMRGEKSWRSRGILILMFGAFTLYGAFQTIPIAGGFVDTRSLGTMAGGLLAGPWVGLGAGVFGAVHRYMAGGFTVVSGTLYALLAGGAGGLFFWWKKGRRVTPVEGMAVAAAYEVFAACMTLGLAPDFSQAWVLVQRGFGPMVIAKTVGIGIFVFIVNNLMDAQALKAEKEIIEGELRVARDIQMGIVPKLFPAFPERPEVDVYAVLDPAKEVGGDFYDFFFADENRLCFSVGDVSGKGVPASLFMAVAMTLLRTKGSEGNGPSETLVQVNNALCRGNDASMFVTTFIGALDVQTGEIIFANGGHNLPYIRRKDGRVEAVPRLKGVALGAMEDMMYQEAKLELELGDALVVYTDGISEAMNRSLEQYGNERLEKVLAAVDFGDSQKATEEIIADVKAFVAGADQSDDITLLVMVYRGSGNEG